MIRAVLFSISFLLAYNAKIELFGHAHASSHVMNIKYQPPSEFIISPTKTTPLFDGELAQNKRRTRLTAASKAFFTIFSSFYRDCMRRSVKSAYPTHSPDMAVMP